MIIKNCFKKIVALKNSEETKLTKLTLELEITPLLPTAAINIQFKNFILNILC